MGDELEVIGPHVAPPCEEKGTVLQWLAPGGFRVRNSEGVGLGEAAPQRLPLRKM